MTMRQQAFPFLKTVAWAEPPEPESPYRYVLYRSLDGEAWDATHDASGAVRRLVCFVLLNPSKASAETTDPTIDKLMKFGRRWGYERLAVVNLFAVRETDSTKLRSLAAKRDLVGPGNDEHILHVAAQAQAIVCGWGKNGDIALRGEEVTRLLASRGHALCCFKKNLDGSPVHPLYQFDAAELRAFP